MRRKRRARPRIAGAELEDAARREEEDRHARCGTRRGRCAARSARHAARIVTIAPETAVRKSSSARIIEPRCERWTAVPSVSERMRTEPAIATTAARTDAIVARRYVNGHHVLGLRRRAGPSRRPRRGGPRAGAATPARRRATIEPAPAGPGLSGGGRSRRLQRHGGPHPGEVLVEVDAEHLPAREPAEVQPERRRRVAVGAEEHHPDLDLHAPAVRRDEARVVRDLLLQAPGAALRSPGCARRPRASGPRSRLLPRRRRAASGRSARARSSGTGPNSER